MRYERFEDLPVWNDAIELAARIFQTAAAGKLPPHPGFRDQIQRAVLSISNNIAEGFERGTTQDLLTFLYIAKGSAGEVRSMLALLERIGDLDSLKSEILDLKSRVTSISRQLGGWIDSLKNSSIKGSRYNDDGKKQSQDASRQREAFLEELRRVKAGGPPAPDPDTSR
jgi:four helix bundle protein